MVRFIWRITVQKCVNWRFFSFMTVMPVIVFHYLRPLRLFCVQAETPVCWGVFPFIFMNNQFITMYWLFCIYLHMDIPFMQCTGMYQVIRAGRNRWLFSHMAGIVLRSFAAAWYTFVVSVLCLIPHLEWTGDWGKVIWTLAQTSAYETCGLLFEFPYVILGRYRPFQLVGIQILLLGMIASLLGEFMLLVALSWNRMAAVIMGIAWVIMSYVVQNIAVQSPMKKLLAKVVPAVWGKFAGNLTRQMGVYWQPSLGYMCTFLVAGILICISGSMLLIRHIEFNWINEDE